MNQSKKTVWKTREQIFDLKDKNIVLKNVNMQ